MEKGKTMNAQSKTKGQHVGDILKLFLSVAAALSAVVYGISWVVQHPSVSSNLREIAGTNEVVKLVASTSTVLETEIAQLSVEQTAQRKILEEVVVRVDRLEPSPRITEYDSLRSRIDATCALGKTCTWTYLARRTDFGASCAQPNTTRILRDSAGIVYFPDADAPRVRRLNTEWTRITGKFIVPTTATLGISEFYMTLVYSKCGLDRNQSMAEDTLPLIFTIVNTIPDTQ